MEAGAVGFVVKDAPAEVLAAAIRRVVAGERVVDPQLAAATLATGDSPLTPRERDVLSVAGSGASVAEIATTLYLWRALSATTSRLRSQKLRHETDWTLFASPKSGAGYRGDGHTEIERAPLVGDP